MKSYKFLLEDDDCASETSFVDVLVRKQLGDERRRDLVRDVGHTYVKIRQITLEYVSLDNLKLIKYRRPYQQYPMPK